MRNCCGCVNMRTGVVTIGIIGSVMTGVALLLQFAALSLGKRIMKNPDDQSGNNLFSFVIIIGIVVCFFKLLSDCLVIYGAINQTTREVSVWLSINLCVIIYVFMIIVFLIDLLVLHETNIQQTYVFVLEGSLVIINVVYIYVWYQVYTFSRQLDLDGRTSLEGILQTVNRNC